MQTYISENQPSPTPIKVVRPNISKVLVKNLIYISGSAAVIIILIIYLDRIVGLDVFTMVFEGFGISVSTGNVMLITISIFIGAAVLYFFVSNLSIMNLRYEFYRDHVRFYAPLAGVALTHIEIPYRNIIKISYEYKGFMNKLLNSGEINIEATGMKEGSAKMEVLDQTEELVAQLTKMVNDYKSLQQMQFEENRKIGNIMRKF